MNSIKINGMLIKINKIYLNLIKNNYFLGGCRLFIQTPLCRFSLSGLLAQRHGCLYVCSSQNIDVLILYAPCLCGGGGGVVPCM
jgi:hypothetical protein